MTSNIAAPNSEVAQTDVLAPLRFFYGLASQDLRVTFIKPEDMPEEERWLLVHETDMTPRLSEHHRSVIGLDVHAKTRLGDYLVRASVLRKMSDGAPVEFGAIGIHLAGLSEEAQRLILEGFIP
ncbi:MAG: hypothetical protein WCN98_15095, partial [Verrucomicrobiaceae bacterium]